MTGPGLNSIVFMGINLFPNFWAVDDTHLGILLPATIYYHLRQNLSRCPVCTFVVFYLFYHTSFFLSPYSTSQNPKKRKEIFVGFPCGPLVFFLFFRLMKNFCVNTKFFVHFLYRCRIMKWNKQVRLA